MSKITLQKIPENDVCQTKNLQSQANEQSDMKMNSSVGFFEVVQIVNMYLRCHSS